MPSCLLFLPFLHVISVRCAVRRGVAHVCGFVLIVMGLGREEEAFWVVTALLEDKLFGYCGAQVRVVLGFELGFECQAGNCCLLGFELVFECQAANFCLLRILKSCFYLQRWLNPCHWS